VGSPISECELSVGDLHHDWGDDGWPVNDFALHAQMASPVGRTGKRRTCAALPHQVPFHTRRNAARDWLLFHGRCSLHNMRPLSMSLRVQGQPHLLPLCLCRCHCAYTLSPRLVPEFLACNLPRETSMPWLVNCYRSPQSQVGHEFGHGMADDQGRQTDEPCRSVQSDWMASLRGRLNVNRVKDCEYGKGTESG
jgi:hypothetical protein